MTIVSKALKELRYEEARIEKELARIREVITAFSKFAVGRNGAKRQANVRTPRRRRTLSLAARKRIAAAQRARWAKVKAKHAKKVA